MRARVRQTGLKQREPLIWLSGADPDTLARSPRERRKYSGLGGIVLTTSVMAALSAGFALHNGVRAPLWAAVPIAALWGLAIANLDRWLVAASARRDKWWQNLGTLVPRLLLALVIGAVVSTPLVLWIFNREIQAQIAQTQRDDRNTFEQKLLTDSRYAGLPKLQADVTRLQQIANGSVTADLVSKDPAVVRAQGEFNRLDARFSAAQASAICEFDGTCGTKEQGGGSAYQTKLRVANELRAQRAAAKRTLDAAKATAQARQVRASGGEQANAKAELVTRQAQLTQLTQQREQEVQQFRAKSADNRGLLAQLQALSKITDANGTLKTAYLTLLVFITAIEILPVLTKFLLNIGPASAYDEILASGEQRDVETARQSFAYERERHQEELRARKEKEKELLERVAEREAAIQEEVKQRELDEMRRAAMGQPSAAHADNATRRWRLRFPGQRQEQTPAPGYTAWPADEQPTRPFSAAEPVPEETAVPSGDEESSPRWRFN